MALVFVVIVVAPAQAGSAMALSFPQLIEQRSEEVTAGISHLVSITDEFEWPDRFGTPVAYYRSGYLEIPQDNYGVFDDLKYLVVDPLVLGINPKFIRKDDKGVVTKIDSYTADQEWSGGAVVIYVDALRLGTHVLETEVRHRASKTTTRILFVFKHHNHYQRKDSEAMVFSTVDASRYVEEYCRYQLGIEPAEMNPDDIEAVRSAYYDSRMKGVLEFTEPMLDYSLRADGLARERQGFPAGLSEGQDQPDPEVSALREEIAGLRSSLTGWQVSIREWKAAYEKEVAARKQLEQLLSEKPIIADFPSPTVEVGELDVEPADAKSWQDELRACYAGKTGWIFQLVGPDGEPTNVEKSVHLWLMVEQANGQMSWEPNVKNPVEITGHDVWLNAPRQEWKYFGVSNMNGVKPTKVFSPASYDLHILAIPIDGGAPHEVH